MPRASGVCGSVADPARRSDGAEPAVDGSDALHRVARRHGLVLRLGGGPRRPVAGRAPRHRRWRRGARRGGVVHLRSARLRHPFRHAVGRGPAPLPPRGVPPGPLRPLRRDERAAPRRAGAVLAGGGGHRPRRGVRRRGRGASAARPTSPGGARDPRGGATSTWQMECGVGVARTKLLAKLASRAAKPVLTHDGPRPGPGVVVVLPGPGAVVPPPPAGAGPVGSGPRHGARDSRRSGSSPSAIWPASPRTRCAARSASPTAVSWPSWPGVRTPDPVEPNRDAKSVGHEETFAVDIDSHDGLHRHVVRMADAVGTRLREARADGSDGHREGPLRRPRHHHPVAHGGGAARLPPRPRGGGRGPARRRGRGAGCPPPGGVGLGPRRLRHHRAPALLRRRRCGAGPARLGARWRSGAPWGAAPLAVRRARRPRGTVGSSTSRRARPWRRRVSWPGTRWRRRCRPSGPATATRRWALPPWWAETGWR